jgi:hypothetical protein
VARAVGATSGRKSGGGPPNDGDERCRTGFFDRTKLRMTFLPAGIIYRVTYGFCPVWRRVAAGMSRAGRGSKVLVRPWGGWFVPRDHSALPRSFFLSYRCLFFAPGRRLVWAREDDRSSGAR